jgi:hypothetical protein
VDREYGPGVRPDPGGYIPRIQAIRIRFDIGKDGNAPHQEHGGGRGNKGVRGDNHLCSRSDPEGPEGDLDGHTAVGHRETETGAMEAGKALSEEGSQCLRVISPRTGKPAGALKHLLKIGKFCLSPLGPGRIGAGPYRFSPVKR